jgi:hypothetical protein
MFQMNMVVDYTFSARKSADPYCCNQRLTTRALDMITLFFQLFHHDVAMVALNFNNPFLYGAATAALLFELTGKPAKPVSVQGNTGDERHAFALAALGFPSYPHYAVAPGSRSLPAAGTGRGGIAAVRAHPAVRG